MKHTIVWMLMGCLMQLFFTGCESSDSSYYIGVSQCSDDEWRTQLNREIEREALFYPGVTLAFASAHDDSRQQVEDIEALIKSGVDLLVIAPNEATSVAPAVEKAYRQGIPVVLVDRRIDSDQYTAYVGADNYEMGYQIGQYVASRLKGVGKVVELTGLQGSTPAIERHNGFVDALAEAPEISLLATVDAGWREVEAEAAFDSVLNRYPQIDLVFAQNDRMGAGARKKAVERGCADGLLFVGIDALPGKGHGVEMVSEGLFDATFIYPTGGDRVVQVAMNILQEQPYQKETLLSTALVNKDNARIMRMQTQHIETLDGKIEWLDRKLDDFFLRYSSQRMFLVACIVILMLVCGLLVFVVRAFWTKNRLNKELSAQKQKLEEQRDRLIELSKKLEEATHAKLAFFTNVSHDFRTPLTLIADPVEQLKQSASLSERDRYLLNLIDKNVTVLLRLINQTLDFRKVENGKIEMRLSSFNLANELKEWTEAFRALAYRKHIGYRIQVVGDEADYEMVADQEKMERITYNLLSNAFKFTPEGGRVDVSLKTVAGKEGLWAQLQIIDSGLGIAPEELANIFENYYQIGSPGTGSGIGLALVKAFVEMHRGTVRVDSQKNEGTAFTVDVPLVQQGELTPVEERAELPASLKEGAVIAAAQTELTVQEGADGQADKETLLVIEDNADVRRYIRTLLSDEYQVLEAGNGEEGLQQATGQVPDIIVCDVMMPVMDGWECCRKLKADLQTSHIPVLMLTAYTLEEQQIRGYECGADAYLSKPFTSKMLKVRLRNLLENRRRIQQFFKENTSEQPAGLTPADQGFVGKLQQLIEAQLGDSELGVEALGMSLGLGRVQLYRKTKALTGYGPNELLRIARLKRAKELLAASDKTISEITYEVGFTSPSYFAKCYKDYFGESPTDAQKRSRKA